jgi:hypothetical protein
MPSITSPTSLPTLADAGVLNNNASLRLGAKRRDRQRERQFGRGVGGLEVGPPGGTSNFLQLGRGLGCTTGDAAAPTTTVAQSGVYPSPATSTSERVS